MTARHGGTLVDTADLDDRLRDPRGALAAARAHIDESALHDDGTAARRVGLELEAHLVDLDRPDRRPDWDAVQAALAALPELPAHSNVTVEPGGQIELSTPPADDVVAAVAALQADRAVLRDALTALGYGAAALGTDIARPVQRVNPASRYVAMESHFAALGCADPGRTMMSATAALQVNLDAGPAEGWAARISHIRDLGPLLIAISACSPLLAGRGSGWRSMRQQAWHGIDARRSSAVMGIRPTSAWADYALQAPVMLVRDGDRCRPVTSRATLADWLEGDTWFVRRPTREDIDYHLTTLFPPVRPRGYVEIRCLDAVPDRWWPGLAGLVVTLIDDDEAAERSAAVCAPVRSSWLEASRTGLRDPQLREAAQRCAEIALERCPAGLRDEVGAYAELLARGLTPGDEVAERADRADPVTVLAESADG